MSKARAEQKHRGGAVRFRTSKKSKGKQQQQRLGTIGAAVVQQQSHLPFLTSIMPSAAPNKDPAFFAPFLLTVWYETTVKKTYSKSRCKMKGHGQARGESYPCYADNRVGPSLQFDDDASDNSPAQQYWKEATVPTLHRGRSTIYSDARVSER